MACAGVIGGFGSLVLEGVMACAGLMAIAAACLLGVLYEENVETALGLHR